MVVLERTPETLKLAGMIYYLGRFIIYDASQTNPQETLFIGRGYIENIQDLYSAIKPRPLPFQFTPALLQKWANYTHSKNWKIWRPFFWELGRIQIENKTNPKQLYLAMTQL